MNNLEVIQTEKEELEQRLIAQGFKQCPDCKKYYKHLEICKDNKDRCKKCKKKRPTNIFYNPNQQYYLSKYSVSKQEYKMLLEKYLRQGYSYTSAKSKVNYDLTCLKNNKAKKFYEEQKNKSNIEIKEKKCKELNKEFLKGLGQTK